MSTRKNKYKAVIFDLGGVVMTDGLMLLADVDSQCGLPHGTMFKYLHKEPELMTGKMTMHQYFTKVAPDVAKECNLENPEVITTAFDHFLGMLSRSIPDEHMMHAIKILKTNGFKVALLSNGVKVNEKDTMLTYCKYLDMDVFDEVIDSVKVGLMKPQPEIYKLTLDKLGVGPDEAIFLDDIEKNIVGAREVGIKSILVNSAKRREAISELSKELGINVLSS